MTQVTRRNLIILAAGGSFVLLAGAFVFQALGYAPCAMCIWQRWPHGAAIAIGVIALFVQGSALPLVGMIAAATTSFIGAFHAGVEYGWWAGPTSCTAGGGGDLGSLGGDLLSFDGPRLVLCDQATMVGPISMAGWNAVLSAVLVVLWMMAARRSA